MPIRRICVSPEDSLIEELICLYFSVFYIANRVSLMAKLSMAHSRHGVYGIYSLS